MRFNKWMDKLPYGIKIAFAIIPLIHLIWVIYQIIRDTHIKNNRAMLILLDIVFGLPLFVVSYIINIINVIKNKTAIDYNVLFKLNNE